MLTECSSRNWGPEPEARRIRIWNAPFFLSWANFHYAHAYPRRAYLNSAPINAHQRMSSPPLGDMSLHETGVPNERTSLQGERVKRSKGCYHAIFGVGAVECLNGEDRRPRLPDPKRPDVPLSHNQYELQECFPCVYKPLHYFLLDRLPILGWVLQYNVRWLLSDVVAGLTVGLMVVPQALAYAKIANLELKVSHLYPSFIAGVYCGHINTFKSPYRDVIELTFLCKVHVI